MNMNTPYPVLIVEDEPRIREHLSKAIETHEELILQNAVGTAADAHKALRNTRPRAVLMDIGLPDGNGIDLIRQYSSPNNKTEFMVLSIFDGSNHIIDALEAGATGYLTKDTPVADIAPCILQLIHGGSPVSPMIARKMLSRFQPDTKTNPGIRLTPREQQILQALSKGLSHHETATAFSISYHTLIAHVKNIYKKLSVHSRSEALYEAGLMGLINRNPEARN